MPELSASAATKSYHHGDLRAALLAAARARLATGGYELLSLRALARDIGVASSAPYAHFSGRDALLAALTEDGAAEIGSAFHAIEVNAAPPELKLAQACHAYLSFALVQPELMRLLYASSFTVDHVPEGAAYSLTIFETLVARVMTQPTRQSVRDVAVGCWSTLHGFAMLRLHKRLAQDIDAAAMANTIVESAVRLARTA